MKIHLGIALAFAVTWAVPFPLQATEPPVPSIAEPEREALLALYAATDGHIGCRRTDGAALPVRLFETSHLERIAGKYERAITHGTYETITIELAGGGRVVVDDYAASAPAPAWLMKRAIAGALFNAIWDTTVRSPVVVE
jgi:hypothetical protein